MKKELTSKQEILKYCRIRVIKGVRYIVAYKQFGKYQIPPSKWKCKRDNDGYYTIRKSQVESEYFKFCRESDCAEGINVAIANWSNFFYGSFKPMYEVLIPYSILDECCWPKYSAGKFRVPQCKIHRQLDIEEFRKIAVEERTRLRKKGIK